MQVTVVKINTISKNVFLANKWIINYYGRPLPWFVSHDTIFNFSQKIRRWRLRVGGLPPWLVSPRIIF